MSSVKEVIEASYTSLENYFGGLATGAVPPMAYDPSFLGYGDTSLLEEEMLRRASTAPTYSEAAIMDTLIFSASTRRDLAMRSMSRKDYYQDAALYYAAEQEFLTKRKNINTQFVQAKTPVQKV